MKILVLNTPSLHYSTIYQVSEENPEKVLSLTWVEKSFSDLNLSSRSAATGWWRLDRVLRRLRSVVHGSEQRAAWVRCSHITKCARGSITIPSPRPSRWSTPPPPATPVAGPRSTACVSARSPVDADKDGPGPEGGLFSLKSLTKICLLL